MSALMGTEQRRYQTAVLLVCLLNLTTIWIFPLVPGQDIPQHLTYVRIFADYHDNALFRAYFHLPERLTPYDTIYVLLASLARLFSVSVAFKLLLSAYVVGTFAGLGAVVRATQRLTADEPPWPVLFGGVMLLFNPSYTMGFLPYSVAQPVMLYGCALCIRHADEIALARGLRERWLNQTTLLIALCVALLVSIHIVAAAVFALVALCQLLARRSSFRALLVILGSIAITTVAWRVFGSTLGGKGTGLSLDVAEKLRASDGLDFLAHIVGMRWDSPPTTLTYLAWSALGPYRLEALPISLALLAPVAWIVYRDRRRATEPLVVQYVPRAKHFVVWFAVATYFLPNNFHIPDEVMFVAMRVIPLCLALALALVPVKLFATGRAQLALVLCCVGFSVHYGVRTALFNREGASALRLLAAIKPHEVVMPIVFADRSAHFGKRFRVTRFLSVYHNAFQSGLSTQFWAKFVRHLPIEYRVAKRPIGVPDWRPDLFDPAMHLVACHYVLVSEPTSDEAPFQVRQYRHIMSQLRTRSTLVKCDGGFCLYRIHRR